MVSYLVKGWWSPEQTLNYNNLIWHVTKWSLISFHQTSQSPSAQVLRCGHFSAVVCDLAFPCSAFWEPRWCTSKCKHQARWPPRSLSLLPSSRKKKSDFNGFSFRVPPPSLCELFCGGWRADVNAAFNYKSNSKRARLHCPPAPTTKAQPSEPHGPRCSAETEGSSECQRYAGNAMLILWTCRLLDDWHEATMLKAEGFPSDLLWRCIFYLSWFVYFHQTCSLNVIFSLLHPVHVISQWEEQLISIV